MIEKSLRVEQLKKRAEGCCCSFCGGDLHVRRIVLQTQAESRIELYCEACEKIEYGVPRALYASAKAAVQTLGFNCYPELEESVKRERMNIAKLANITSWQLRYLGVEDGRFSESPADTISSMDADTIVSENDLDKLLKEVELWSSQPSD